MGCKKTAVKIAKAVAAAVTPALVRHAGVMVGDIERMAIEDPTFWTDEAKRRVLRSSLKAEAKQAGIDVKGAAIGMLSEYAVEAIKNAGTALDELGADDTDEPVTA